MAINLRLPEELESELRAEAERSGRSQHEIILRALGEYLSRPTASEARRMLKPPRTPFTVAPVRLRLPDGMTSLDLLDREDRI